MPSPLPTPRRAILSRVQYSPYLPRDFPPTSYFRVPSISSAPPETFFLRVTANTMPGNSTIRSWAKRRMRDALVRELKGRGWGRDGRWRGEDLRKDVERKGGNRRKSVEQGTRAMEDLRGLLRVFTLSPILQATGEEVQREASSAVGNVVKRMEEERRGRGRDRKLGYYLNKMS